MRRILFLMSGAILCAEALLASALIALIRICGFEIEEACTIAIMLSTIIAFVLFCFATNIEKKSIKRKPIDKEEQV